jgi:hypothetical protein
VEAHLLTAVQQPDQLDGLFQHGQAHACRRPRITQDVLVERLAAPDAQHEATVELYGRRGRRLRDDGGMRTVGQVTAVVTGNDTASDSAPITDHTNGLLPCSAFHG